MKSPKYVIMALPFKDGKDHRIYKSTTLQSVVVAFDFGSRPADYYDESFYLRLDKFTTDKFSLKVGHGLPEHPFQISNSKLGSSFLFSNGIVTAVLPRNHYVSFEDTAMPHVRRMREYVNDVVHDDKLERVFIRKLNIWQVVDVEDNTETYLTNLKKAIFSNEFLTSTNDIAMDEQEKNVLIRKIGWEEDEFQLVIRNAFVPVPERKATYNLVLDLELVGHREGGIPLKGLPETIMKWNQTLFNAFQWCMNDEIIKKMEG